MAPSVIPEYDQDEQIVFPPRLLAPIPVPSTQPTQQPSEGKSKEAEVKESASASASITSTDTPIGWAEIKGLPAMSLKTRWLIKSLGVSMETL